MKTVLHHFGKNGFSFINLISNLVKAIFTNDVVEPHTPYSLEILIGFSALPILMKKGITFSKLYIP
jgi:hypothetical protein